jgi:hypothetical protein
MEPTVKDLVSIQCSTCRAKIRLGDSHCPSCMRKVTRDEIAALRRRWEAADPDAARRGDAVVRGRAALLVVGGLAVFQGFLYGVLAESVPTFAFGVVIGAIMVALFFWGARRPVTAMVAGLAVYLVLQALAAIGSVITLGQGITFKVVTFLALTAGISAELHRRKLEKDVARRRAGSPAA